MIKVCDAIMGSGKSQSAISFMNENPDRKFVYITPYLDEARRIARACPGMYFAEPSNKLPDYSFSKLEHTRELLSLGRNIATTHSAFRSYTDDMVQSVRERGYTLLVDEAVEVFQEIKYSKGDIMLLLDGGHIREEDGVYFYTGKEYDGSRLRDLFEMLRCNNLIPVRNGEHGKLQYYYWALPLDIFQAFQDVYVMTYMFEASELYYFMRINSMEFTYIGIEHSDGIYRFSEDRFDKPAYLSEIKDKVHVFQNVKLNEVGWNKNALSARWMINHPNEKEILRKNVYSYLRYHQNAKRDEIMWSTYKKDIHSLRGRGYSNQSVEFNKKASNEYRNRTIMAYCVNLFPSPHKASFFRQFGVEYNADGFALSTMIQWIWRSAIRDGKEVWVYIPSRRMRELLINWLDCLAEGGG